MASTPRPSRAVVERFKKPERPTNRMWGVLAGHVFIDVSIASVLVKGGDGTRIWLSTAAVLTGVFSLLIAVDPKMRRRPLHSKDPADAQDIDAKALDAAEADGSGTGWFAVIALLTIAGFAVGFPGPAWFFVQVPLAAFTAVHFARLAALRRLETRTGMVVVQDAKAKNRATPVLVARPAPQVPQALTLAAMAAPGTAQWFSSVFALTGAMLGAGAAVAVAVSGQARPAAGVGVVLGAAAGLARSAQEARRKPGFTAETIQRDTAVTLPPNPSRRAALQYAVLPFLCGLLAFGSPEVAIGLAAAAGYKASVHLWRAGHLRRLRRFEQGVGGRIVFDGALRRSDPLLVLPAGAPAAAHPAPKPAAAPAPAVPGPDLGPYLSPR